MVIHNQLNIGHLVHSSLTVLPWHLLKTLGIIIALGAAIATATLAISILIQLRRRP